MAEDQAQHARAAIIHFIESLKGNKGFEPSRVLIRVMPKGLFVDERAVDVVVKAFQEWLVKESNGAARKTDEKSRQWLFEGHTPERFYLVEGKSVLLGLLIPIAIQAPQKYGLPYYLGSLLPTDNYLHPDDPEIRNVPGLELRQSRMGLEAVVRRREKLVIIPETALRAFHALAQHSRFLQRRYPGCEKSLSQSVRALAGLVCRARVVPRTYPIVVPHSAKVSKLKEVRVAGTVVFLEEKGVVTSILEFSGRHLSSFLRAELQRAPREMLGSFKLMSKHRDLLGFYEQGRARTEIHARAFSEFEELIRRAREPRERFQGWFTAAECFQKFAMFFQLSQPIERHKISAALERFGIEAARFRIHGGWIFCLSREGAVVRTVAKHIRLPGHRRLVR